MYKVKIDVFEGPFDLLVYLIEKSGVSIYDVNISEITDQFLDYVHSMEDVDPDTSAYFMVLASTLIHLKSQTLLPKENEKNGNRSRGKSDPRDELAKRIREYKKYKRLAVSMRRLEERSMAVYAKPREDISRYTCDPDEELITDIDKFIKAFQLFLRRYLKLLDMEEKYVRIRRHHMTVEEKADQIEKKIADRGRISFDSLIEDSLPERDRFDIVLTFSAVLEMISKGRVTAMQNGLFGSIELIYGKNGTGVFFDNGQIRDKAGA